ncbi:hypothetical protein KNE206_11530 [Kitasatospora sp. NE20-6]
MAAPRDPRPVIRAERRAPPADAERPTPGQRATPSLCAGRTVQETLAHMAATAWTTPVRFALRMARRWPDRCRPCLTVRTGRQEALGEPAGAPGCRRRRHAADGRPRTFRGAARGTGVVPVGG